MPCLKCGCPWWKGDDWDAVCIRCEWSCEADGYDDDSVPLPEFKAKYDHFRSLILKGVTAPWTRPTGDITGSTGKSTSTGKS
jgi:hypothetical protein